MTKESNDNSKSPVAVPVDASTERCQMEFSGAVILEMCELCDRNSPEDEPDAMVANAEEMHGCIERALERTGYVLVAPAPHSGEAAPVARLLDIEALKKELMMSKMTHNFTFSRDEVLQLLGGKFSALQSLNKAPIGEAGGVVATKAPFPNCQFRECDLPGQCRAEGRCHHPVAAQPQAAPSVCKLCNASGDGTPCAYPTEINRQQAERIAELEQAAPSELGDLLGRYWESAFDEGKHRVSHGTEAQEILSAILTTRKQAPIELSDAQYLSADDMASLIEFNAQCEESDGYTVRKEIMKRLAELGAVQGFGFGKYGVSSFGSWLVERHFEQPTSLPLRTVAEHNAIAAASATGSGA